MSANDKGKFCLSCSKNVIDFSKLSDAEIVTLLEDNTSKVCGRFNKEQLNTLITNIDVRTTSRLSTLLAGLLVVASTGAVSGQNAGVCSDSIQVWSEAGLSNPGKTVQPVQNHKTIATIEGIITDEATNKPLRGASVFISSILVYATTDSEGKFKISIPASIKTKQILSLEIAYIGYYMQKHSVLTKELPVLKNIAMKALSPEDYVMGEVVITSTKRKAIKKRN
jgi:hypothetical protein